jgi:O-antigen ligase
MEPPEDHPRDLRQRLRANLALVVRGGILAVLAFAPMAFGAVHPWAYGTVWLSIWLLVCLWMAEAWLGKKAAPDGFELQWVRIAFQPFVLAMGVWILLQCIPLPTSWVEWIQPRTIEAYRLAAPLVGGMPVRVPLSLYPYATFVWFFHLWSWVALFYLTLYHLRTRRQIMVMAVFWIAMGTFQSIYGLVEYLSGTHRIWWWENTYGKGVVTGTFINRNHLAGYLEMMIPMALGVLMLLAGGLKQEIRLNWRRALVKIADNNRWAQTLLLVFLCTLMGAALFLSFSRGASIALTTILVPLSIFLLFRKPTRRYGLLGLGIFLGTLLYAAPMGLDAAVERFAQWDEGVVGREEHWRSGLEMVKAFPGFGTGWGTYEWVYPHFKPAAFGESVVTHAHNEWLEAWVETGVIGLILVVTTFALYLAGAFRVWLARRDTQVVWLGFCALAAVLAVGVHCFGEFLLRTPANALTLAAVMAWGWAVIHHHRRGPDNEFFRWPIRRIRVPRPLGYGLLAVVALIHAMLGAGMVLHLTAERLAPTVRNSTVEREQIQDFERLRKAIDLEPVNARRWAWMAREADRQGVPPEVQAWASRRGIEPQDGTPAAWARAFLERAIRLNPTNPKLYEQMGWILAARPRWRDEGSAEYALRAAVYLEPNHGGRYFHLGHYLLLDGRPQEAQDAFARAVELSPRLRPRVEQSLALLGDAKREQTGEKP